jgi:hypothetical protein
MFPHMEFPNMPPINVILKKKVIYEVFPVDNRTKEPAEKPIGEFVKESDWKGMSCLKLVGAGTGELVISTPESIFGDFFDSVFNKSESELIPVITASPSLINSLRCQESV